MNADEARQITRDSQGSPSDGAYLEAVFERIRQAAKAGRSSTMDPWHGTAEELRMPRPTGPVATAVWEVLKGLGFKVVHHLVVGELGKPGSDSRTEISW